MRKRTTITITIRPVTSIEIMRKVAANQGKNKDKAIHGLQNIISQCKWRSDHFSAVAETEKKEIVGYAGFIQRENDPADWLYTDLWVKKSQRRRAIATSLVNAGMEYLSGLGAKRLYCNTWPENRASIALQASLGFSPVPAEPFNDFLDGDLLMFRRELPQNLSCMLLEIENTHAALLLELLESEKTLEALHMKRMLPDEQKAFFQELKAALQGGDPDEAHFIVHQGIVPVAWLKINGLLGEKAWISMLAVHEKFQRQGIGSFAVGFAEAFAKSRGFTAMGIHTTADNIPARKCYERLGYQVVGESDCVSEDGVVRRGYTFTKTI